MTYRMPLQNADRRWFTALGAACVTAAFATVTLVVRGVDSDGVAWALAQLLFGTLAVIDLRTRRIPNIVVLPAMAIVLVLRALFEPHTLVEASLSGAAVFACSLVLALASRGGLGMGDVKLAGLLGLLLGRAVVPGLLVGTLAGGVAAVLAARGGPAGRRTTIAYGPYLCFGAAVAILAFGPPPLL